MLLRFWRVLFVVRMFVQERFVSFGRVEGTGLLVIGFDGAPGRGKKQDEKQGRKALPGGRPWT